MRCEALEDIVVKTRKELQKLQGLYHQSISSIKASEELKNIPSKKQYPLLKKASTMKKDQVVVTQKTRNQVS